MIFIIPSDAIISHLMHLLLFRGDDVLGEQTSIYEIFGMKGQVFSQLAYIPQNEQSSAEDNPFL